MTIQTVGVLGCGLMGSGIAEVCAKAGLRTFVREVNNDALEAGRKRIEKSLARAHSKGRLSEEDMASALARIELVTELEALADCDLVIEAIVENLDIKCDTFKKLDAIVKPEALFASNTSSLTITEIAVSTERLPKFLGLHFFNPVPVMKLVEIVRTIATSDESVETARDFVRGIGKESILCKDNSGFIVNRLLVPFMFDAIRALEEGVGSLEDIDKGMVLGCGHPMGPLTLTDFVGLDTCLFIGEIMFDEYREKRFAPPPLLKQMVLAGRLGRKSGQGFYDYR